ncbi:hypothetical protein M8J75_006549 [Diaphorina citri]|nr:hypothetical protein M8J75_006549 [Diaphorina citri]
MKVTVTSLDNECFLLDVSEDLELENFKAFCEVQSGISAQEIAIEFQGNALVDNKKTLKDYNIQDGDLVLLKRVQVARTSHPSVALPNLDFSGIVVPGTSNGSTSSMPASNTSRKEDPAQLKQLLLADPHKVSLLKQNNPQLADALLNGSLDDFARILRQQYEEREKREQLRQRMLTADPFDTEAQKLIAEEIKKSNIQANMEAAMEYNPETFGSVIMLYINCRVNGHPVKAFIDSGAQTTIMSAACAARVNITRLIDTRWAGIAKGVGVQRIIGRIHMVQIAIENDFLTTSFSCCIDLQRNVLQIGTTGTETPFLAEADLPEVARLTYNGNAADEELLRKTLEESRKQGTS